MDIDGRIDELLEDDDTDTDTKYHHHAVSKHDTTLHQYQRRAGPETTGGRCDNKSLEQSAPRTASCINSWGPGPAISRGDIVHRPDR